MIRAFLLAATIVLLAVPTAAASNLPTGTRVEGNCVWLWDFPDEGFAVCHGDPDCPGGLSETRNTIAGGEKRRVVP